MLVVPGTSLNVESCIIVVRTSAQRPSVFCRRLQNVVRPVVVGKKAVCGDAVFRAEHPLVLFAESAVERQFSVVVGHVIPLQFECPSNVLRLAVDVDEEILQPHHRCLVGIEFRVHSQGVDAVVFHQTGKFQRVSERTVGVSLRQFHQRLRIVRLHGVAYFGIPRHREHASHRDTILSRRIADASRHSQPWCRPVAVGVDILPHREVVALKTVAGQSLPFRRRVVERCPQEHPALSLHIVSHLIVAVGDALERTLARDEELVIDS